nr:hypothetical protein CFP56_55666 [Quercus suber]
MYNHLKSTLDLVGELNRVALENVYATATEASTQATGRGGGGRGCNSFRGRIIVAKYILFDDEVLEGNWGMYMDGVGSSRCTSDAVAQPSHPAGHDDSAELTSCAQAGPYGSAHDGGCIFVPTPSRSTPPIVQAEPTQDPSFPNPDEPVAQIEQIQSENIGQVRQDRQSQL